MVLTPSDFVVALQLMVSDYHDVSTLLTTKSMIYLGIDTLGSLLVLVFYWGGVTPFLLFLLFVFSTMCWLDRSELSINRLTYRE